uniref:Uncharacterized protein n=1 Tax=Arundo donax TaxID=35708 RepID=A0A0A9CA45_ARUDO
MSSSAPATSPCRVNQTITAHPHQLRRRLLRQRLQYGCRDVGADVPPLLLPSWQPRSGGAHLGGDEVGHPRELFLQQALPSRARIPRWRRHRRRRR